MNKDLEQGICLKCGKPLALETSLGYHTDCAQMEHNLEQAAEEYAFNTSLPSFYEPKKQAFIAGYQYAYQQKEGEWISVSERTPELIEGKEYSENVFAILDGRLAVMNFGWGQCELDNGQEGYGWFWANCYGDINGDSEWDDDYKPTHWMPLPKIPLLPPLIPKDSKE